MQKLQENDYSGNMNELKREALNLDWGTSWMKMIELVGTMTSDGRKVYSVEMSIYEAGKESLDEETHAYGSDIYEAANTLIAKIAKVLDIELESVVKPEAAKPVTIAAMPTLNSEVAIIKEISSQLAARIVSEDAGNTAKRGGVYETLVTPAYAHDTGRRPTSFEVEASCGLLYTAFKALPQIYAVKALQNQFVEIPSLTLGAAGNEVEYTSYTLLFDKWFALQNAIAIRITEVLSRVVEINPFDGDIDDLIVAKPGWVARRAVVLSMREKGKSNRDIAAALNDAS